MPDINSPRELIDRSLVAKALDRDRDGVVSPSELREAGVSQLAAEAVAAVNAGGEQGEAMTVGELTHALRADQVRLSGQGNVTLENGWATFVRGMLEPSTPWSFPIIPGLQMLEEVRRIAPSSWSLYNPDQPGPEFTYTAPYKDPLTGERVRYREGMTLKDHMFLSEPDSQGQRWVMVRGVRYDELAAYLRVKGETMRDLTRNAPDPELRAIHEELSRVLWSSHWNTGSRRDRARDLFQALQRFERIEVPAEPQARLRGLDGSLREAAARIEEQGRIVRELPVERAREAVGRAEARLASPTHALKLGLGGGLGVTAGALAALAGGLALPIALGIGAAGLAVGYGLGWLTNHSRANRIKANMAVLQRIDPTTNRRSLEQHAVVGYKLLQDARHANTLATVRAYSESAERATTTISHLTGEVAAQTRALQAMEALVRRHGGQ
ncbi:MAG: hypothetical protein VKQ33_08960 [Candidatus Sericytochromatia bacterium]|nr:hypothetical protein [Candidatus Sericytochromatia bacterium]